MKKDMYSDTYRIALLEKKVHELSLMILKLQKQSEDNSASSNAALYVANYCK